MGFPEQSDYFREVQLKPPSCSETYIFTWNLVDTTILHNNVFRDTTFLSLFRGQRPIGTIYFSCG